MQYPLFFKSICLGPLRFQLDIPALNCRPIAGTNLEFEMRLPCTKKYNLTVNNDQQDATFLAYLFTPNQL